jgi:hypothetical protein
MSNESSSQFYRRVLGTRDMVHIAALQGGTCELDLTSDPVPPGPLPVQPRVLLELLGAPAEPQSRDRYEL